MSMTEIHDAIVERGIGRRQAADVIRGWDKYSDVTQENGERACVATMDLELVRLLDAALEAHWNGCEPYPTEGMRTYDIAQLLDDLKQAYEQNFSVDRPDVPNLSRLGGRADRASLRPSA
jgi:hypothetical protein